jgi:hypothetical protein
MKINATLEVKEVIKPDESRGYRSEEYDRALFSVVITGDSTKEVEVKIGKLQEAITHMGWKLA